MMVCLIISSWLNYYLLPTLLPTTCCYLPTTETRNASTMFRPSFCKTENFTKSFNHYYYLVCHMYVVITYLKIWNFQFFWISTVIIGNPIWKSKKKYERRKCLLTFTTALLCSCSTFRPVLTVFRPQVRVVRRFVFNKREEEFGLRTDPSRCPQFLSLRRERGKTLFFPSSVLFLIFMIPE